MAVAETPGNSRAKKYISVQRRRHPTIVSPRTTTKHRYRRKEPERRMVGVAPVFRFDNRQSQNIEVGTCRGKQAFQSVKTVAAASTDEDYSHRTTPQEPQPEDQRRPRYSSVNRHWENEPDGQPQCPRPRPTKHPIATSPQWRSPLLLLIADFFIWLSLLFIARPASAATATPSGRLVASVWEYRGECVGQAPYVVALRFSVTNPNRFPSSGRKSAGRRAPTARTIRCRPGRIARPARSPIASDDQTTRSIGQDVNFQWCNHLRASLPSADKRGLVRRLPSDHGEYWSIAGRCLPAEPVRTPPDRENPQIWMHANPTADATCSQYVCNSSNVS